MASVKNGDRIGYVTWLYLPKKAARIAEGALIRHCQQGSNCPHVHQKVKFRNIVIYKIPVSGNFSKLPTPPIFILVLKIAHKIMTKF